MDNNGVFHMNPREVEHGVVSQDAHMSRCAHIVVLVVLVCEVITVDDPSIVLHDEAVLSVDVVLEAVHTEHRVLKIIQRCCLLPSNMIWQRRRSFKRDQQAPASGQLSQTLNKAWDSSCAISVAVNRYDCEISV